MLLCLPGRSHPFISSGFIFNPRNCSENEVGRLSDKGFGGPKKPNICTSLELIMENLVLKVAVDCVEEGSQLTEGCPKRSAILI